VTIIPGAPSIMARIPDTSKVTDHGIITLHLSV
jgi:hypothetical protein